MNSKLSVVLGVIVLGILSIILPPNTLSKTNQNTVTDLSWPNCSMTTSLGSATGIIGVTGGLDFHPNRCLNSESKLFNTYSLYMNTGYPGPSYAIKYSSSPLACGPFDMLCLAYNYGFSATHYAVNYAGLQAVHASMWWLDVETTNSWTSSTLQNRATLRGMVDALKKYTFLPVVGFYSNPEQWDIITGGWMNGYPVWVATGTDSFKVARSFCVNKNFTGGSTWLAQYTTRLDHNYVCNSSYSELTRP